MPRPSPERWRSPAAVAAPIGVVIVAAALVWLLTRDAAVQPSLGSGAAVPIRAAANPPTPTVDRGLDTASSGDISPPRSGPWSVETGAAAGPQSSAQALASAVSLLTSSGLLSDLPEVVRQLSTVQPLGDQSPIDDAFVDLVQERSPSSFRIFQDLVLDDLTERTLARQRGESPAPLSGDQARQIALRMVIAAELGRTSAQLDQIDADEVLTRSFDALVDPSINQPDLARVLFDAAERRVGPEPSREEQAMADLTIDQARGLTAEQQRAREMSKALLARAMESAARQGRKDAFHDYTRRYLRIRMGDTPEQAVHWRTVEQSEIARLRLLIGP